MSKACFTDLCSVVPNTLRTLRVRHGRSNILDMDEYWQCSVLASLFNFNVRCRIMLKIKMRLCRSSKYQSSQQWQIKTPKSNKSKDTDVKIPSDGNARRRRTYGTFLWLGLVRKISPTRFKKMRMLSFRGLCAHNSKRISKSPEFFATKLAGSHWKKWSK